jgi:hypothetical protein
MLGKRTAIVLGAGASYCYAGGSSGIPTQQDIIGRLFFGADTNGGEGFPSFAGPSGPQHSFRLAKYLRSRFKVPEDASKKNSKMDYWVAIQALGYNLETLYGVLEAELQGDYSELLDDFAAIVRTAVLNPVGERGIESVCPHHRRICEAIEPGDYFIDFNWDSVVADTLLYYSHFWFPISGFGVAGVYPLLPPCQKARAIDSLVHLFPIHGSVVLFELDDSQKPDRRGILYLGPRQWSPITGLLELHGVPAEQLTRGNDPFTSRPKLHSVEERLLAHGHLFLKGNWFKPLFIPPSKSKTQYRHWFFQKLLTAIHSFLPSTERFIVAGYSFPEADATYLKEIFVPAVILDSAVVEIINPANDDGGFQARVREAFPGVKKIRFEQKDFRAFCAGIDVEYPDRPGLRAGEERKKSTAQR